MEATKVIAPWSLRKCTACRLLADLMLHGVNKAIAYMPPGHCLGALLPWKCFGRHLQFHHRMPFALTKEKIPWCTCTLKKKAYKAGMVHRGIFSLVKGDGTIWRNCKFLLWAFQGHQGNDQELWGNGLCCLRDVFGPAAAYLQWVRFSGCSSQ